MRFVPRKTSRGWQVFDTAAGTTCGKLYATRREAEEAAALDERWTRDDDLAYELEREEQWQRRHDEWWTDEIRLQDGS